MKWLIFICFYCPLFLNILNTQVFIGKFVSVSLSQAFAYVSVGLILSGTILLLRSREVFNPIIKTWFFFYICYYGFGLLASASKNGETMILSSLIPFSYFIGYSTLLSIPEQRRPIEKILTFGFFISCIILIIFQRINFSMDFSGIYKYSLERAGGVYGDANNAAVASILSFIFINNVFKPNTNWGYLLKVIGMLLSGYALILTFSKTGFLVFAMVLVFTYYKWFTPKRIILTIFLVPTILIGIFNWVLNSDTLSKVQKYRLETLLDIATFQIDKVDFSSRDILLKNMLSFIYESPFLGNGIGFSNEIRGHNTILGVWADSGFFTFVIFIGILIFYFIKALKAPDQIKFFSLSILFTLCIFMLSLQTIINQGNLLVVLIFLSYVLFDTSSNPLGTNKKN